MNYIRSWTTLDKTRDIQHAYDTELTLAAAPLALVLDTVFPNLVNFPRDLGFLG